MTDIKTLFRKAYQKARADSILFGRLGKLNPDTSVSLTVDGRVDQLWVTLADKTAVQARNEAGLPHTEGLAVKLRAEGGEGGPRSYVLLGRSTRGELSYPDETPPSGVLPHPMEEHSDVVFDDPQPGDFFGYDGDDWINLPLQETVEDFVADQFTGNTGRVQFSYDDPTGEITAILDVSTADRILYSTAADTWAETALTSFIRTLLDDADAATARSTLGLVIGTHVQAYDATLASLAALGTTADRIAYTTGTDTWAETPLTSFARNLLDDANNTAARSTLGLVIGTDVQAFDAELAALAGLTSAADRLPYFTGSGTAALATFTSFGRSLVDDADEAAGRTTLGLVAGGAGDIWVEKAGDTMTGNLAIEHATPTITFESPNQNIIDGVELFKLAVRADDSSASLVETEVAYIKYVATGTWNSGNAPGLWTFGALRQQTIPAVDVYVDDILTIGNKGQVGIGTRDLEQTPSNFASMQLGSTGLIYIPTASDGIWFVNNAFNDAGWKYRTTAPATSINMTSDDLIFYYAVSGTIDTTATWVEMARFNGGKLGVGVITTVGASKLGVQAGSADNDAAVGGVLFVSTTQGGNVTTGEDNLIDPGGAGGYSVPANTLAVNGQSIWFEASGTFTNNANTKQLRVRFGTSGTNLILDAGAGFAGSEVQWILRGRVTRTGAATQKGYVTAMIGTNPRTGVVTGLNQTLSGAVTLRITGEATSTNDILLESFIVGWDDANS